MSREELSEARIVVVVIGPASTKVYQDYVVQKLMRYLRWSNLVRKHFVIPTKGNLSANDLLEREHVTPTTTPGQGLAAGCNQATTPCHGEGYHGGDHAVAGSNGFSLARGGSYKGASHRYTFSDAGKAAALTTIAVQESAKTVASWLRGTKGGVAVVEAGSSGWGSTRHGREALPGFLRATAGPDVGLLWVELLPSGLVQHERQVPASCDGLSSEPDPGGAPRPETAEPRAPERSHRGSRRTGGNGAGTGLEDKPNSWVPSYGFPCLSAGHGERVVEAFSETGSLVGAGGHVYYESLRGGSKVEQTEAFFVSLADQGADAESQLPNDSFPLVARVGAFAAALRMKESWHGCPIYLTRHGESMMNQDGTMGGNSRLSDDGSHFALELADFFAAQSDTPQSRLAVWCSPMQRAVQTARVVRCHQYIEWQALRELDTGIFNGCSYKEMERDFPEEFNMRAKDKLCYQYPQGEGYLDVVNRLDSVVVALEKEETPVVIISHQAVLRCLYAYFMDVPLRQMPRLSIPLHTVVKLTPSDEEDWPRWKEHRFQLMHPSPLEQLAVVATGKGGNGISKHRESLS